MIVKRKFHIMSIKSSLNVWSNFDKRSLDYLIILGKVDWLSGRGSLWSLRSKFFCSVYRDLVWFHKPKNHSFNCPANAIQWTFSIVDLIIVPFKLYRLIKVCHWCKRVFKAELQWASITPQNDFFQLIIYPLF